MIMVKATQTGRKVYHINSGQKTMKKSLGRRRKNESYPIRSIKCMVDSAGSRFKCSIFFRKIS